MCTNQNRDNDEAGNATTGNRRVELHRYPLYRTRVGEGDRTERYTYNPLGQISTPPHTGRCCPFVSAVLVWRPEAPCYCEYPLRDLFMILINLVHTAPWSPFYVDILRYKRDCCEEQRHQCKSIQDPAYNIQPREILRRILTKPNCKVARPKVRGYHLGGSTCMSAQHFSLCSP